MTGHKFTIFLTFYGSHDRHGRAPDFLYFLPLICDGSTFFFSIFFPSSTIFFFCRHIWELQHKRAISEALSRRCYSNFWGHCFRKLIIFSPFFLIAFSHFSANFFEADTYHTFLPFPCAFSVSWEAGHHSFDYCFLYFFHVLIAERSEAIILCEVCTTCT
jgi:hypothetical protein